MLQYSFEKFCKFIVYKYCRLNTNSPPPLPSGPFIVCSNHQSHLDTPILMLALQKPFTEFKMLAAKDHFQPDIKKMSLGQKFLHRALNLIFVDRTASPSETRRLLKECELAVAEHKNLIIYPEGTRSSTGQMQSFKTGSVYIAYKLNIPIIPAAIIGSGQALAKNHWFIWPKKIKVRFGDIIIPEHATSATKKQSMQQLTQQLEHSIKALLEQNS